MVTIKELVHANFTPTGQGHHAGWTRLGTIEELTEDLASPWANY